MIEQVWQLWRRRDESPPFISW